MREVNAKGLLSLLQRLGSFDGTNFPNNETYFEQVTEERDRKRKEKESKTNADREVLVS